jgi:hypothetical protein
MDQINQKYYPGLNSTTPSDDESDNTPSTSRASSPMVFRKRGRLSRGVKLNHAPEVKSKFSPITKVGSRSQQQQQHHHQPEKLSRKLPNVKREIGFQDDDDDDLDELSGQNDQDDYSDESDNESGSESETKNDLPPIRQLKLLSNPEFWSPMDTARFIAQTTDCGHLAHLMVEDAVDGQAFMLLTFPTVKEHWQLKTTTAIQLCQHIESVRLAHILQF